MSWRGFWQWVDGDFDNLRPYSVMLFCLLVMVPLGLAFAVGATDPIVEVTRWFAIVAMTGVFCYYVYRVSFVIARSFKSTFGTLKSRHEEDSNG